MLVCGIYKKKTYKLTYTQNRSRPTDIENKQGYQEGKGEKDRLGGWD